MDSTDLLEAYRQTRTASVGLCHPLKAEDYRIQTMSDVSPPWWNLGHTTWFFAKNILEPLERYEFEDTRLEYVLNSYYEAHGKRIPRGERGLITRPTTEEIYRFREEVDSCMEALIEDPPAKPSEDLNFLVVTGIQHEQQHQELLLTEVKHILGSNPPALREPYVKAASNGADAVPLPAIFHPFEGGLEEFGNLEGGWCWDNELPVHRSFLEPFTLLNRLITNGEYAEFIADGGYRAPLLWLANGWEWVQNESWEAPLYWELVDGAWRQWTLGGCRDLDPSEPVCHVSYYEADAFASWKASTDAGWKGARLPTEREWELAARHAGFDSAKANLMESARYHPQSADDGPGLQQVAGDLWEWTSSHYEPYPRYEPFAGDLMEYNGKFMDNQRVLRGGSCATPRSHIRASYRNFWAPSTRFQFTGIRLAKAA